MGRETVVFMLNKGRCDNGAFAVVCEAQEKCNRLYDVLANLADGRIEVAQ
ncbi:hypothetical protein AB0T83_14630 [Fluviibacterium sp. DFM31]|uniref:Uncharacterized protein n=1 Tax=Meridianimarinicoccus marinus TaxID=3231483 RepID=A0ABV3L8V7_9RHOB